MITRVLVIVFFVYVLQSTFAWLQIKRSYGVINKIKSQYRGKNYRLVTGTGRTKFFLIARGYFIILVVNDEDMIIDYYGMDGYTVFATPKQKSQYIGMNLDDVEQTFKKKNEKNAFTSAREQLTLLREQSVGLI